MNQTPHLEYFPPNHEWNRRYHFAEQERIANLTLYEKEIESQLDATLLELQKEIPIDPQWGVKKSQGKNVYWFGY